MMDGAETDLLSRLSSATGNGVARRRACAAAASTEYQPAAAVSYQSKIFCQVIINVLKEYTVGERILNIKMRIILFIMMNI